MSTTKKSNRSNRRYLITKKGRSPRKVGGKHHGPLKALKKSFKKHHKKSLRKSHIKHGGKHHNPLKVLKKSFKKSKKHIKKEYKKSKKHLKKSLKRSHSKHGGKRCGSGQVMRKGYTTKKGTVVRETCIRDLGKPGKYSPKKGEKPIKLSENDLAKYGYSNIKNKTADKRRAALKKAVAVDGYLKVMRKVNALSVLTKTTDPIFSNRTRMDVEWLKKTFSGK